MIICYLLVFANVMESGVDWRVGRFLFTGLVTGVKVKVWKKGQCFHVMSIEIVCS